MVANFTITKDASKSLASTIKMITDSVIRGKFELKLWDGSQLKASFMLSKLANSSFVFHRGPEEVSTDTPTKLVPPIHTNLWPLIYSGIGVFSLIALCILWQCCKQSYLLRKKKYTDINSNRINTRKKKLQDAMANQESTEIGASSLPCMTSYFIVTSFWLWLTWHDVIILIMRRHVFHVTPFSFRDGIILIMRRHGSRGMVIFSFFQLCFYRRKDRQRY